MYKNFVSKEFNMNIHILQHGKSEIVGPGTIQEWAKEKKHKINTTRVDLNEPYPELNEFDFLIILGGVQGAYEEEKHPWLKKEKNWIRYVIEQQKHVLGICLGAQLIAESMGGKAKKHSHKEVGWWPIKFVKQVNNHPLLKNIPDNKHFYQFHQDTFTLPSSGELLAYNHVCKNQAFSIGNRVLALQFHPEMTLENATSMIEELNETFNEESSFIQNSKQIIKVQKFKNTLFYMKKILNNFEYQLPQLQ